MQPKLPRPEHYSYLRHRKQRNMQIILPVVFSALLMLLAVILISLATFKSAGDVARWAAISTIWIIIPILIGGLLTLALLLAIIYGLARALGALPHYTGIAQDYVYIARGYIIRGADMAANPIIEIKGFLANLQPLWQRIIP